jgi:membrane fusion protein, multidrug efflux system
MSVSKTVLGFVVGVAATVLLGSLALQGGAGFGTQATNAALPAGGTPGLPVPVFAVVKRTVPVYLDYVGTTEAIRTVTLQAKVTGYLAARGAADGADVVPGDLLYRIDPRDYQTALDQVTAQAERDTAALDYSRASQRRNARLSQSGWTSKDANDQTTSALHQSEAALAADQAAIRTAQLNLGYTEIRAPFAGRLGKSLIHEGALINAAGTQLNTLVQLDPIYVTFNPSEIDLAEIAKDRARGAITTEVRLAGDAETRFRGTLSFLDNAVDRTTGTITARATIANPGRVLLPGQYVRVRLHVADLPDALLVPQTALGSSQLGRFVYVVGADNKAEQRFVSLGATDGPLIVIGKGLREGDRVIVGNLQKIGPGAPVEPLPEQAQSGS